MSTKKAILIALVAIVAALGAAGLVFGAVLPNMQMASLNRSVTVPATPAVPIQVRVDFDGADDTTTDAYFLSDAGDVSGDWPFDQSMGFGHRTGWSFPDGTHEVDVTAYNARQGEAGEYPVARLWVLPASWYEILKLSDDEIYGDEGEEWFGDEGVELFGLSGYRRGETSLGSTASKAEMQHCVLMLPNGAGCVYADVKEYDLEKLSGRVSVEPVG